MPACLSVHSCCPPVTARASSTASSVASSAADYPQNMAQEDEKQVVVMGADEGQCDEAEGEGSSSATALAPPEQPRLVREISAPVITQRNSGGPGGILLRTTAANSSSQLKIGHQQYGAGSNRSKSTPITTQCSSTGFLKKIGSKDTSNHSCTGDLTKPPSSLFEAASRAMSELHLKRLHDRKSTQRQMVAKFVQATAVAFEAKDLSFANDPSVGSLLHEDIVLITYDKMKFFGKRVVQKKLNQGMEQMLSLATHMSSDHLQSLGAMADKPNKIMLDGPSGAADGPGLSAAPLHQPVVQVVQVHGLASTESPGTSAEHHAPTPVPPQAPAAGKKPDNKLSSGSGESSLVPTGQNPVDRATPEPPVPLAAEAVVVESVTAEKDAKGKKGEKVMEEEEQSFGVEGPTEVKENTWTVTYTWRYRRSFFQVLETFTIADYKIKKLKRSRV